MIERSGAAAQEWLHTPDDKLWREKSPAYVVQCERLRLPLGISGQQAMTDCDCPLCQMMADSGPFFWEFRSQTHGPGIPVCAVFCHTRSLGGSTVVQGGMGGGVEREQQEGAGSGEDEDDTAWLDEEVVEESSPVWQQLWLSPQERFAGRQRVRHRRPLGRVDCGPAEAGESQDSIDTLNGDFRSLREAVADPSGSFVDPVVWRFGEHLASISELRPELSAKCKDLERQLDEFARRLSGEPEMDDEIPF